MGTQCQLLGNVSAAMLVKVNDGTQQILAKWPDADSVGDLLHAVFIQAQHKQRLHLEQVDEHCYCLAQPLFIDGAFWGVVALKLNVAHKKALADVVRGLKLGQFWLQFLVQQQSGSLPQSPLPQEESAALTASEQAALLQLSATLLNEKSLQEMVISLVNMLASSLAAARVSVGLLNNQKLQLEAISYAAHVDDRTQVMQEITEAMREALEQGFSVSYSSRVSADETPSTAITRAHQQLLQSQQLQSVSSFLVRKGDHLLGVLTIELDKHDSLTHKQHAFLQTALHVGGAIIALKQESEAGLKQILVRGVGRWLRHWFGGAAWRGRLVATVVALLAISVFIPVSWRVSGSASLQATEKYVVVSPQDGYLGRVVVRPGDSVKKAALLAALNDEDLLLGRRKLASQVQRYRQAYDAALANLDRVEAAIANAQMDQAAIQLRLVEQQLQRTQLLAPIDGIIVSDDVSQHQGAPVKQGDVLFELAAANDVVVQLFVDERDIAALVPGQQGQVKFTSLPDNTFSVQVKSITPISEVREGRNYFRVELTLLKEVATESMIDLLRPGMTGTGKVSVGHRPLGWIWFHDLWYWLRLSLW